MPPSRPPNQPELLRDSLNARLLAFLYTSTLCGFCFSICFYWTDAIAKKSPVHWRIRFDWEKYISFQQEWFYIYISVLPLVLLVPFAVEKINSIKKWGAECLATIAISSIFFLLIPSEVDYAPHTQTKDTWINLVKIIAGAHNLFPSLHVALTTATILAISEKKPVAIKILFTTWGALIFTSTILTHQHHFPDVISGWLLAWSIHRINPPPAKLKNHAVFYII